jgi:hypothetical protein
MSKRTTDYDRMILELYDDFKHYVAVDELEKASLIFQALEKLDASPPIPKRVIANQPTKGVKE